MCDSLVFSLFVEEHETDDLSSNDSQEDAEHGHDGLETGNEEWSVFAVEQQGANDVTYGRSGSQQTSRIEVWRTHPMLYSDMMALFLVCPAVLEIIHETIKGFPPNRKARR